MQKSQNKFKRDELYALLLRMWAAGMVYLFIGFGTSTGEAAGATYFVPMLVFLTVGITVASLLIVHPAIRYMLKTRMDSRPYLSKPLWLKIARNIAFFFVTALIVLLVSFSYAGINILLNKLKGTQNNVYLGVEPLGFALLYGFYYFLYERILYSIYDIYIRNSGRTSEKR